MSHYARGAARERQVLELLEGEGWDVVRVAGSRAFDLAASRPGHRPMYVEVKSTAAGPFSDFGPAKRAELLARAGRAGATPVLIWWPPRRPMKRLTEDDWPDA